VPDRDVHLGPQCVENPEALGLGDVFEVEATERRLEQFGGTDELVRVFGTQSDRHAVDTAEVLEKQGLAFHHRH